MFENLTSSLGRTLSGIRGRRLTENNIQDALRDVRIALLEADVALSVIEKFIDDVRRRAIGSAVTRNVRPGEEFIGHVKDALVELLGRDNEQLNIQGVQRPAVILMAGVQGVGKTTTAAKLGKLLQARESKKVAVVSTDVYRPAAIDQLRTLAKQADIRFIASKPNQEPVDIAKLALSDARRSLDDVLIVDTAGRQSVDEAMMTQIRDLHKALEPQETLFVVDAIMGQDAAATATAFNDALPLSGTILAKADGDARGGAALTVTAITGKPIKFIGNGEGIDGIEPFHPGRIASRILGMGDVLSLLEQAERTADKDKSNRIAEKFLRGHRFNFEDLRDQFIELQKIGGWRAASELLPSELSGRPAMSARFDDEQTKKNIAMIDSMTVRERRYPNILNPSRKKRIAAGSGTEIYEVNILLRTLTKTSKQTRKLRSKKMLSKMSRATGIDIPMPNQQNKNKKKKKRRSRKKK